MKKRVLAALLTLCVIITLSPASAFAMDTSEEEPNSVETLEAGITTLAAAFPDENFRAWVKEKVLTSSSGEGAHYTTDEGGNEILTEAGIEKVHAIKNANSLIDLNIHSLAGIEHFTALTSLNCMQNKIRSLDVSALSNLTALSCRENNISSLNISGLTRLVTLNCGGNQLNSLDVSHNPDLITLQCFHNQINSLDLSCNKALTEIGIYLNPLSELQFPGDGWNKGQVTTFCYRNTGLKDIDLTGFTGLTSLNVTSCTNFQTANLKNIYVSGKNRPYNDYYLVRVEKVAGLSMDETFQYFIVDGDKNTQYGYNVPTPNASTDFAYWAGYDLSSGGVLDNQGNLVVGATAESIVGEAAEDYLPGDIRLTNTNKLITPTGKITFAEDSAAALRNGKIVVFKGQLSLSDLVVNDIVADNSNIPIAEEPTIDIIPNGSMILDTVTSEAVIPAGSQIIDNRDDSLTKGQVTIVTTDTIVNTIDSSYSTQGQTTVTVPAAQIPVGGLTKDNKGNLELPQGTVVVDKNGNSKELGNGILDNNRNVIAGTASDKPIVNPDGSITVPKGGTVNGETFPYGGTVGADGTVTKGRKSSSGGSSTYAVSVPMVPGGSVYVTPKNAAKGGTVTVTVTPETGYQLDSLTVTDKNGTPIKLTDKGNGTYTFTMPAGKTTVNVAFAETGLPFTDVKTSEWYYESVKYVYENGLFAGTADETFSPNDVMTRAMLWTVLYRKEGSPDVSDAGTEWYADASAWAMRNGLTDGTMPNAALTREQLVTILYRYAGSPDASGMVLGEFADADLVSGWADDATRWAAGNGLLQGKADNRLDPTGQATRAEVAAMLMRFAER